MESSFPHKEGARPRSVSWTNVSLSSEPHLATRERCPEGAEELMGFLSTQSAVNFHGFVLSVQEEGPARAQA